MIPIPTLPTSQLLRNPQRNASELNALSLTAFFPVAPKIAIAANLFVLFFFLLPLPHIHPFLPIRIISSLLASPTSTVSFTIPPIPTFSRASKMSSVEVDPPEVLTAKSMMPLFYIRLKLERHITDPRDTAADRTLALAVERVVPV